MADLVGQLVPVGATLAGVALAELLRRGNDRRVDARERRARLYTERRQLYARVHAVTQNMRWAIDSGQRLTGLIRGQKVSERPGTTFLLIEPELALLASRPVLDAVRDVQQGINSYEMALPEREAPAAEHKPGEWTGSLDLAFEIRAEPELRAAERLDSSIVRLTNVMRADLGVD